MAHLALFHSKNMKKYSIYLLILFFSCTKEKQSLKIPLIFVNENSDKLSTYQSKVYHNGVLFSGYLIQIKPHYPNDTLVKNAYFNGMLNGISQKWYPNQQIQEIRYYREGKKDGLQVAFWENGFKKFEFTARNDTYEGELKEWDIHGKLFHLGHFEDGQEEGVQKLWYDNGKIKANYVIIDGKRYGLLGTKNCKNVRDSIPGRI